jgi:hypothetical protein
MSDKRKKLKEYLNDPKRAVILVKKGYDPKKLKKLAKHYAKDDTRGPPLEQSKMKRGKIKKAVSPEMAALLKALQDAQDKVAERNRIIESTRRQEGIRTRSGRITQPIQRQMGFRNNAQAEVARLEKEIAELEEKEKKEKRDDRDDDDQPPRGYGEIEQEYRERGMDKKGDQGEMFFEALKRAAQAKAAHGAAKKVKKATKAGKTGRTIIKGMKMGARLNPIMMMLEALSPMIEREVTRKPPRGT